MSDSAGSTPSGTARTVSNTTRSAIVSVNRPTPEQPTR